MQFRGQKFNHGKRLVKASFTSNALFSNLLECFNSGNYVSESILLWRVAAGGGNIWPSDNKSILGKRLGEGYPGNRVYFENSYWRLMTGLPIK